VSVGFTNAVADGLRYNGVPVSFEPGWQTRGNGYSFPNGRPAGLIVHHTGDSYGGGLSVLVNGRSDLDPPLCNSCGYPDGRIHVIAAQPANHAGAGGGPSMGPLPVTRLFNPQVWGHEVMYPGLKPWTDAQYRSARVLGAVISGVLGRTSPEWVRGHFETSIEGKWDPGVGDGQSHSFDMARFRREMWAALQPSYVALEADMPAGEWQTTPTATEHAVCFPIGSKVSSLTAQAWLSVFPNQDCDLTAVAYGGGHALASWTEHVAKRVRFWKELPNGTEGCSVTISTAAPGVAGWCLELKAREA
jgi:N-acetylmuramoyl-L-alanine amidase